MLLPLTLGIIRLSQDQVNSVVQDTLAWKILQHTNQANHAHMHAHHETGLSSSLWALKYMKIFTRDLPADPTSETLTRLYINVYNGYRLAGYHDKAAKLFQKHLQHTLNSPEPIDTPLIHLIEPPSEPSLNIRPTPDQIAKAFSCSLLRLADDYYTRGLNITYSSHSSPEWLLKFKEALLPLRQAARCMQVVIDCGLAGCIDPNRQHKTLSEHHTYLGKAYETLKQSVKALKNFQDALASIDRYNPPFDYDKRRHSVEKVKLLIKIGMLYKTQNDPVRALEACFRGLTICRKMSGLDGPEESQTLMAMEINGLKQTFEDLNIEGIIARWKSGTSFEKIDTLDKLEELLDTAAPCFSKEDAACAIQVWTQSLTIKRICWKRSETDESTIAKILYDIIERRFQLEPELEASQSASSYWALRRQAYCAAWKTEASQSAPIFKCSSQWFFKNCNDYLLDLLRRPIPAFVAQNKYFEALCLYNNLLGILQTFYEETLDRPIIEPESIDWSLDPKELYCRIKQPCDEAVLKLNRKKYQSSG